MSESISFLGLTQGNNEKSATHYALFQPDAIHHIRFCLCKVNDHSLYAEREHTRVLPYHHLPIALYVESDVGEHPCVLPFLP